MGAILAVIVTGFFVGGLARWAVPGPDPMPIWLTILIGMAGSALGGGVATAIVGSSTRGDIFVVLISSIAASALLVVGYRLLVQKRPLTGPEAYRLPTRGIGIARMRDRLRRLGIDPDSISSAPPSTPRRSASQRQAALDELDELYDQGKLTDEEYRERRIRILRGEQ